ncbi:dihydrofolate reductase family protein [Actibacterium pelagium]|uniref:Uncharacterized protein n=1 Tax=Actibacterium pelagium TaxID=2029103 RepID=A0A917AAY8_9RHOB|nr:hypothetical protein [Actibacterium pelagium]GGE39176.1 hypothetical protein GCM10011517_03650 [Actibacterium pelagium]
MTELKDISNFSIVAPIDQGKPVLNYRQLITEVDLDVPDADTFFPDFDPADWRHIGTSDLRAADPRCVLHEYLRI